MILIICTSNELPFNKALGGVAPPCGRNREECGRGFRAANESAQGEDTGSSVLRGVAIRYAANRMPD